MHNAQCRVQHAGRPTTAAGPGVRIAPADKVGCRRHTGVFHEIPISVDPRSPSSAPSTTLAAADWPQWRGPNRDNQSTETGLYRDLARGRTEGALEDYRGRRLRRALRSRAAGCTSTTTTRRRRSTSSAACRWPTARRSGAGATPWTSGPTTASRGPCRRSATQLVFSLDPKCRFHALDIKTGKLVWQKNLVQDYKATIPGWYAGQNPLLDGNRVVLATGGDALAVAFDQATGQGDLAVAEPGQGPDVAQLADARHDRRRQAVPLHDAQQGGRRRGGGRADPVEHPVRHQDGRRARRRSRSATAGCSSRAATKRAA